MRVQPCLLWLGGLLLLQQPLLAGSFSYITVSDPNAFSMTQGFGINDAGQIVGSEDAANFPGGFLYSSGAFSPINYPFGTTNPTAINDHGQIVGYYLGTTPTYTNYGNHGFIYQNGTFQIFDAFGSTKGTNLTGINSQGVMVGTYTDPQGRITSFISDQKKTRPFNVPNSSQTQVVGINDFGHISGSYIDASGEQSYAFLYANHKFITLAFPGARQTFGAGLNDSDEVVGTYMDTAFNTHGFLYRDGQYITLDIPGASETEPATINNAGQIVGSYSLTTPYFHTLTFVATWDPEIAPAP